jgi:surface protein
MKITAKTQKHLRELLENEIKLHGNNCDLNHMDVSNVNDMGYMFYSSQFNGDINAWNVSNVNNMAFIFYHSLFNGDLNIWKPYKARGMENLFNSHTLQIPYWSTHIDFNERKIAIDSYLAKLNLAEKLEDSLESSMMIKRVKL